MEALPQFDEGHASYDKISFHDLPIELLHVIASHGIKVYRGLVLACKRFYASLTPSITTDYALAFGYSVRITSFWIEWRFGGELHRTDGPAIEWVEGSNSEKEWYVKGKRHRKDDPAVEYVDGAKEWWINGEPHRINGPAVEYASGTKEWYINGYLHREDGPARELTDGTKEWWINGKRQNPFET